MGTKIRCLLGLHSWSGRVCCKCGAKKGEQQSRPKSVEDLKTTHFPVDLYNHGVRFFNAGNIPDAKNVFLQVYNHPTAAPSFRLLAAGGYVAATKRKKGKDCVAITEEGAELPKEFKANQQEAVSVFILVNLVRSMDPTIEAMTIRMDTSTKCPKTEFNYKGRGYGCSIVFENCEYHGIILSLVNGEPKSFTDPKTNPPPCHEDDVVKRICNDWLVLKPKLSLLPINFVLDLAGFACGGDLLP